MAKSFDDLLSKVKIPESDVIRQRISENIRQRRILRQLLKLSEQKKQVAGAVK